MKQKLTFEQLLALSNDRHISLTANAGTGKTSVLVEKYISLLEEGINPGDIVAITFTRKAAAEMISRISTEISNRYQSAPANELRKYKWIRENLIHARITTIHSFCNLLLKDYPLEANLNPSYTDLEPADEYRILNDSMMAVFEDWLSESEPEKKYNLSKLISLYGYEAIQDAIKGLLLNTEFFDYYKRIYLNEEYGSALNIRNSMIIRIMKPMVLKNLPELISVLEDLGDFTKDHELKASFHSLAHNLTLAVEEIENPSGSFDLFIDGFNKITQMNKSSLLKKDLSIYQKFHGKLDGSLVMKANNILRGYKQLQDLGDFFKNEGADLELVNHLEILLKLADEIRVIIEEEKQVIGAISFDDMMTKTRFLLTNQQVAHKIRSSIKYLMVDEFQDTNELQYEIIKLLVPGLIKRKYIPSDPILFIVGDPKQSIYGFRNADVRVFQKAIDDIKAVNTNLLKIKHLKSDLNNGSTSNDENTGQLRLTVSFRHLPLISALVNRIFNNLQPNRNEFEVEYSDLVCARNVESISTDELNYLTHHNEADSNGFFGSASLLISGYKFKDIEGQVNDDSSDENTGGDDENISDESELLSIFLKNLVESDKPKSIIRDGSLQQVKYSDIAILSRSRNKFDQLTNTLRKYQIPFVLHASEGYYETSEIADIISMLLFLQNNYDDLAFAGVIKSPLCCLDDTDLMNIRFSEGNSLWEKFVSFAGNIGFLENYPNKIQVEFSYCYLNKIIKSLKLKSLSSLIMSILDESGWYAKIDSNPARDQMVANVNKLIGFARTYEKKGFRSLYDFTEEIRLMSEISKEPEAVRITGENAINIMTIHASKGMQFPVVVLFNSGSKPGNRPSFFLTPELGPALKYAQNDDYYGPMRIETPHYLISKLRTQLAEEAEARRLLYVALTRAQDHLIISGTYGSKNSISGFLSMIFQSLDLHPDDFSSAPGNGMLNLTNPLRIFRNNEILDAEVNYDFEYYHELNLQNIPEQEKQDTINMKLILDGDSQVMIRDVYFSATKLSMLRNTDEFLERYRLGLPADKAIHRHSIPGDNTVESDDIIGTFAGTMIHSVLEKINTWLDIDGSIDKPKFDEIILRAGRNSYRQINVELKQRIETECQKIAGSQLVRKNLSGIRVGEAERQFYYPLDNDFLMGAIDLLFKNSEGLMEIWDWKTNRISSPDEISTLADEYELQLKLYAMFVMKLFPELEQFPARLLFTRLAEENCKDEEWTKLFVWSKNELTHLETSIKEQADTVYRLLYHGLKRISQEEITNPGTT